MKSKEYITNRKIFKKSEKIFSQIFTKQSFGLYITVKVTLQYSAPNENKFKDVAGIDSLIKTVYYKRWGNILPIIH